MQTALSSKRSWIARIAVLAMVASLMAIAAPAGAAIDTSASCPASITDTGPFTDLAGVPAAAVDAINCIADYGISTGTSATTFDPFADVPRWQMALFLTRQAQIHGLTLPNGADQGFLDLAGVPAAAVTAINQTAQLAISTGTTATTFDPFADVERWQMALFLTRLITGAGITLPSGADQGFLDLAGVPDAAVTAINQLAQLDISDGTTATTFDPFASVERWQMALFLARVLAADGIRPEGDLTVTNTGNPQLIDVTVGSTFSGQTQVLFEFDENVTVQDELKFFLVLMNGDLIEADDANTTNADQSAVSALFDADAIDYATAGAVDYDAARDIGGNESIPGMQPIAGVSQSSVDFVDSTGDGEDYPELVAIDDFDDADDSVTFEFDVDIDTDDGDLVDGTDFFLVEANGTIWQGSATVDDEDDNDEFIIVEGFVDISGTDLDFDQSDFDNLRRAAVGPAAVVIAGQTFANGVPMAIDIASSGATNSPYLTDVEVTDSADGEWDFEFSESVVDFENQSGNFHLVLVTGEIVTSTDEDVDGTDGNVVNVTFPVTDPDVVVYATYYDTAVPPFLVRDTAQPAAWDSVNFTVSQSAGRTAGADLVSVTGETVGFDDDQFLLTLTFDEPLLDDEDNAAFPDGNSWAFNLQGFKANGDLVALTADEIDDIDGATIELLFSSNSLDTDSLVDGVIPVIGIPDGQLPWDEHGLTGPPRSGGL